MDLAKELIESWDRQTRIVNRVAELVTDETRDLLPSPDGFTLAQQLAHIGEVRAYWLSQFSPHYASQLSSTFKNFGSTPLDSLDELRSELAMTGEAVKSALQAEFANGTTSSGGYDHPVYFLQHMVWHEGWHVGLIFLGLRLGGHEPSEEWSEENVWGMWRVEEWG